MLSTFAREALWFLPFVVPVAFWVCYTDMKYMKIRNTAVLTLLGIFAVVGLITLPLEDYAWRWLQVVVVLALGFVLTVLGLIGAGDAKFAAPMAGFIAYGDLRLFLVIFAATLLGAFVAHRGMRAIPMVRAAAPDWVSWTSKKFPMGLALAGSLVLHLVFVAIYGR